MWVHNMQNFRFTMYVDSKDSVPVCAIWEMPHAAERVLGACCLLGVHNPPEK